MTRRLPPLNALRAFEAVVRCGSLQSAADELSVTAGAISRQIKKLEWWLGKELFERGQHHMTVSKAGDAYCSAIADSLDRIDRATNRLTEDTRSSPLRIVCIPTFAFRWLIPRLARFHDRHPAIDVQLTTSLAQIDFARDRFDAAIRVGHGNWKNHRSLRLADIRYFPVCRPSMASSLASPSDLAHHKLLHAEPSPRDWLHWLAKNGLQDVKLGAGQSFETLNLAYQAAIEGIGVAMGIEVLVADDIEQGRLARPFSQARDSSRAFHLVWLESTNADRRIRALVEWVKHEVATTSGVSGGTGSPARQIYQS